jgi:hypothetical protein
MNYTRGIKWGEVHKAIPRSLCLPGVAATLLILFALAMSPRLAHGQAQTRLTLNQVEQLIHVGAPDGAIAGEIRRRGLDFVPNEATAATLQRLGAGPQTLQAIDDLKPMLGHAKQVIPGILDQIYQALDQGNWQTVRPMLSPDLASNSQKLGLICYPFMYRTHYVESIIERPQHQFEVRVRVLFKAVDEHAYVLLFGVSGDTFFLEDIADPPQDWFGAQLIAAKDMASKFVYAAKAGRSDVLEQLVAPGVSTSQYVSDPRWKSFIQCIPVEVQSDQLVPYEGLKIELQMFTGSSCNEWGTWKILVDQFQGQQRIACITWTNTSDGKIDANCAPNLEADTLKRFGLPTPEVSATLPAAENSPSPLPSTQNQQQESAQQADRQPSEVQTKQFSFAHRHINMMGPGDAVYFCTGNLTISPDGTVRYDCTGTNDPTGRCDHVVFLPSTITNLKMGNGSLHISAKDKGNYDFFGDAGSIQAAYQAIAPFAPPKK